MSKERGVPFLDEHRQLKTESVRIKNQSPHSGATGMSHFKSLLLRLFSTLFIGLFFFSFPLLAQSNPETPSNVTAQSDTNNAASFPLASPPLVPIEEVSPVVLAAIAKLKETSLTDRYNKNDLEAATAFYGEQKNPIWVGETGFNDKGKALLSELSDAARWGLVPKTLNSPDPITSSSTESLGEGEVKATLSALTYARYAKGGRVNPIEITQLFDLTPPVRDPKTVLNELVAASDLSAYLAGLHPQHTQFKLLRAELIKRLGPTEEEKTAVQEPAPVKLSLDSTTLKPGSLHSEISVLRKRLNVPADYAGQETFFDEKLANALKKFQAQNRIKATGQLNKQTRLALNNEGEDKKPDPATDVLRLTINMERWRWMPEDLGSLHVINNIPEYITRTYKQDKIIFKEKLIVGQPTWPTPSFSAQMKTVVFNPTWGVPDGIKAKELGPRLARAGGGSFFEQIFGGGSGGASVLRAYGLTAYRNGKPIDPDSVNWSQVDLRNYSFIQPPGAQNPLGFVKFIFPNTHDVYMHDTTQRHLFAEARRPFSHGCIRVNNPGKFAEVILAEDKGWTADRVQSARQSSETIELEKKILVHNVYLTTWIEDDGTVRNFSDVYGLDSRVSQSLGGKPLRSYDGPVRDNRDSYVLAGEETTTGSTPAAKPKSKKSKAPPSDFIPNTLFEAMAGLVSN
ncbi:MAG: murein L,D-transpeptidase [Hyphomicrobium sp.]